MSKWLSVFAPFVISLGLGFWIGISLTDMRPRSVQEPLSASAAVVRNVRIHQQTHRETGILDSGTTSGDPIGHIVSLSGSVEATLLVTHEIREQNRETLPLLSGETLKRDGFSFAGLTDELLFVRNGKTLQIQREIKVEGETPGEAPEVLPLEVIATFEIGEDAKVAFE